MSVDKTEVYVKNLKYLLSQGGGSLSDGIYTISLTPCHLPHMIPSAPMFPPPMISSPPPMIPPPYMMNYPAMSSSRSAAASNPAPYFGLDPKNELLAKFIEESTAKAAARDAALAAAKDAEEKAINAAKAAESSKPATDYVSGKKENFSSRFKPSVSLGMIMSPFDVKKTIEYDFIMKRLPKYIYRIKSLLDIQIDNNRLLYIEAHRFKPCMFVPFRTTALRNIISAYKFNDVYFRNALHMYLTNLIEDSSYDILVSIKKDEDISKYYLKDDLEIATGVYYRHQVIYLQLPSIIPSSAKQARTDDLKVYL